MHLHTIYYTLLYSLKSIFCFYLQKDAPSINPTLTNQTMNEGDTVSITCLASGTPIPNISWYFNGAPVDKANTMKYRISEMLLNAITKNNTLVITKLELSDMGTYTCGAASLVSSDNSSGILTVKGEL